MKWFSPLREAALIAIRYTRWLFSATVNSRRPDRERPIVFVTAADSTHFRSLDQFISSAKRVMPTSRIISWDLGLANAERSELATKHPEVEFISFPYEKFPKYFDVRIAAGEYAWKPTAIKLTTELINDGLNPPILIWCDAGIVLFRPLPWILRFVQKHAVFAGFSNGSLATWTHPDTLEKMAVGEELHHLPNSSATFVAFDISRPKSVWLIDEWARLAANRSVIAPPGSDRSNHRQDQAVLSCLIAKNGLLPNKAFRGAWSGDYQANCDVESNRGIGQRWSEDGRLLKR